MPAPGPPQHVYNALFPYCVEACTVTQYNRKGAKPGGWGGHATMFMNGATIDDGAGYPRLRLVAVEADLRVADSGTGISVNRIFKNVSWVAIPGRRAFFGGGLDPDRVLDEPFYEATVQKAAAAGWFAGIAVSDEVMRRKPATMPVQEFIVRNSIGTDFALNFARTAYSARLPMSREAMGEVIGYLNGVNEGARRSGYSWDAYTNNCSHVIHNALAAAGVWDAKETRGPGAVNVARNVLSVLKAMALRRMSDFSFPANNFVRVYEAGNERPIDDALAAFGNHDVVRTLGDGWMSTGPGALIATYPMHDAARNQLFAPGRDPFLFSVPKLWDKEEKFKKLTRETASTLTDLGANLAQFRDRYALTLARQRSVDDDLRSIDGQADERYFRVFYDRFYAQIADELRRTDLRLIEYQRLTDLHFRPP
ncbi:MAG TPA: hypothetical protein VGR87_06820 [Candidatus Limnocylindria bacterium]|jgi:hypothetical protein|nr:hypothetical protein [Candidatus Limnocylindria bacterium]